MWCCQVAGLKDSFQLWKGNISPPHPARPRRKALGCPWAVGEATVSTGSLTCPRKAPGAAVLGCEPPLAAVVQRGRGPRRATSCVQGASVICRLGSEAAGTLCSLYQQSQRGSPAAQKAEFGSQTLHLEKSILRSRATPGSLSGPWHLIGAD